MKGKNIIKNWPKQRKWLVNKTSTGTNIDDLSRHIYRITRLIKVITQRE